MRVAYEKDIESASGDFHSAGNQLWSSHHASADRHPGGRSAKCHADGNLYTTPYLHFDAYDPGANSNTHSDPYTYLVHGETR
jgi:hypothetical protein